MGLSSVFTHLDFTPYPWDPDLGVSIRAGANTHRTISPWSPHTNPRAHSTASPRHLLLLPGMTCRSFPDPHAPHLSPVRPGSAQSLFPALSPVHRGMSPRGYVSPQHLIAKGCQSSFPTWAPPQPELPTCRCRTSPSQLAHLPSLPNLASCAIRHRQRQVRESPRRSEHKPDTVIGVICYC